MRIADVMSTELLIVPAAATAEEARKLARASGQHYVLVTEQRRLVGVLCTCTLQAEEASRLLGSVVARPPEVIWPECGLSDAAQRFVQKSVSCLPVCDGDTLVGLVTRADLRRGDLPDYELPGGFCCAACGQTEHVQPLATQPGLGLCVTCRADGYALMPYELPIETGAARLAS